MQATVNISVAAAGAVAKTLQVRNEDGVVGLSPSTLPNASPGALTVRGSNTAGTIVVPNTTITNSNLAVVTWVDPNTGALLNRYNVVCSVSSSTESDSIYESQFGGSESGSQNIDTIAISGGSGANLPLLHSHLAIAAQVNENLTFDFDDIDTFAVQFNTRGVAVFLDESNAVKCIIDMKNDGTTQGNGLAYWNADAGFARPVTGTPITHVLLGSGNTNAKTKFLPIIMGLYNANMTSGS